MGTALAGVLAHRGVFVPAFALFTMNLLSTILLAFAMSTDAFAAAIGKGAGLHKPPFREALRTGLIFGVIEGLTPVIGWPRGSQLRQGLGPLDSGIFKETWALIVWLNYAA